MARLAVAALVALLAASVSAAPAPGTSYHKQAQLPFTAKLGGSFAPTGNKLDIVLADRARIAHIKKRALTRKASAKKTPEVVADVATPNPTVRARAAGASSFPVTNVAVSYIASVTVNSEGPYNLIIDTGSSNTWIGASKSYTPSLTEITGLFEVSYGSGMVIGYETSASVELGPGLTINKQSIGAALYASGFTGVDGILGIGPTDLTEDTTTSFSKVPTVTDNLLSEGTIDTASIGIFFAPTTSNSSTNGELTFGGVDTSKITSDISYTPLTSTSPASEYWGVDQTVSYGGTTILEKTAGIVDTGTTLVYIATDAYTKYVAATGAVLDSSAGLLAITEEQYEALEPLVFDLGAAGTHSLSPNAQIWPRALNEEIGGNSSAIYLVVNDLGSNSGEGLDFIDGYSFLERFYTVYDTTNSRFGIAPTEFTDATSN